MQIMETLKSIALAPIVLVFMVVLAPIFAVALVISFVGAVIITPVSLIIRYGRIRRRSHQNNSIKLK